MTERRPARVVAVSLKMYFGHARTMAYCDAIGEIARTEPAVGSGDVEMVVLPSFVSVPGALARLAGTGVRVGAQDVATHDDGPFTGEVSGAVLRELGCTCVEIGHAERRTLFGESTDVVAAKVRAALRNGLVPLLCVGEAQPVAARDAAAEVLTQVADALPADLEGGILLAYEPYWAIGAPRPAAPDHVAEVAARVTSAVDGRWPGLRIVYGGSAGPGLATTLGDAVDGLFLGRFAHDPAAVRAVVREYAGLVSPVAPVGTAAAATSSATES